LLLLASISHSLLLFRIAVWRSHQEGIKCAFLQESSLFLLVSALVLLISVSNSLWLFLRRLALATKSFPRAVQAFRVQGKMTQDDKFYDRFAA
jgi:hypothetical protein